MTGNDIPRTKPIECIAEQEQKKKAGENSQQNHVVQ